MDGGTLYGAIHFHNHITMSAASPTFKKFNALAKQSIASVSKNIIVKRKTPTRYLVSIAYVNRKMGLLFIIKIKELTLFFRHVMHLAIVYLKNTLSMKILNY